MNIFLVITLGTNFMIYLLTSLIVIMIIDITLINYDSSEEIIISAGGRLPDELQSHYTIQDSSGNVLDTVNLPAKLDFNIYIKNSHNYTEEKINAIKYPIISTDTVEVPNEYLGISPEDETTTYFKGWMGAGTYLHETFDIVDVEPPKIHFVDSFLFADVIIELVRSSHPEGYAGWTTSTIDLREGYVVQSKVILYNFDKLSISNIETLTRHEMGHVVGLVHSTDPDNLMYPVFETNFPYIAPCDIASFQSDKFESKVVCDE